MSQIEFIYFDVGGVVILDYSKTNKWEEMLNDLRIPDDKRLAFEELFDEYELQVCVGMNIDEFVTAATTQLGIEFPPHYSMLDDFANRFEPNPQLAKLLPDLKQKYKLGLLTNMYPGLLDAIKTRNLLPEIQWDTVIDSSVVGLRKPQAEIYELAERNANTDPANILFIENSKSHVEAANQRGWKTLLYDPSNLDKSNQKFMDVLSNNTIQNPAPMLGGPKPPSLQHKNSVP